MKGQLPEKICVQNRQVLNLQIKEHITKYGPDCSLNHIDVSNITDMSFLFTTGVAKKFKGDISKWDTSKVVSFSNMFDGAKSFNGDISKWDTSSAVYMSKMFWGAKAFNQPIGEWDVSKVKAMHGMFGEAKSFKQSIERWDISNVESISFMFFEAPKPRLFRILPKKLMNDTCYAENIGFNEFQAVETQKILTEKYGSDLYQQY